jgi:hypothetical protein
MIRSLWHPERRLDSPPMRPFAATTWNLGDTLGATGIVLTVLVALIIYGRQKRTKYIEWLVFIDGPLLAPGNKHNVQIVYKGRTVADPHIVMLTIYNLSREAIRKEDWALPITVTFPQGAVVSVTPTTNSAEFVAEAHIQDEHTVVVPPLLMNYFDKLTLHILVDGSTYGLDLRARIAGQTEQPRHGSLRSPDEKFMPWLPTPGRIVIAVVVIAWFLNGVAVVSRWLH